MSQYHTTGPTLSPALVEFVEEFLTSTAHVRPDFVIFQNHFEAFWRDKGCSHKIQANPASWRLVLEWPHIRMQLNGDHCIQKVEMLSGFVQKMQIMHFSKPSSP